MTKPNRFLKPVRFISLRKILKLMFFHTLLLILIFTKVNAQHLKDTFQLNSISITSERLDPQHSLKKTNIDSITIAENISSTLSDLLASHSPVFIKTYGQGGLATASFRGTGATHTLVNWNGMEINSPMIGQQDFSMLNVFFIDNINLLHGGSSLVNSSGGLGGSINISNIKDKEKSHLEYIQELGSFSTYGSFVKAGFKIGKWYSDTRLAFVTSANDFPFKNNAIETGSYPTQTREDANYKQYSVLQEIYGELNKHNEIAIRVWLQDNNRAIPQPIVVQPLPGNEAQDNRFARSLVEWKNTGDKHKLNVKLAWFYDYLNYTNKIAAINSVNKVNSLTGNINYNYILSEKVMFNVGSSIEDNRVNSSNYSDLKERKQFALFASINAQITKRLLSFIMLRQELTDNNLLPFLPSLGLEYALLKDKSISLKTQISKNYHQPTLNDLYWYPGGNPNLLPEQGFSAEAGLKYETKKERKLNITSELTYFFTNINNWILWQPDPLYRYWSPSNLKKVLSQGIESSISLIYNLKPLTFRLNANYTYTSAHNQGQITINDNTDGKQLIYIPEHSFNSSLRTEWKTYYLSFYVHYTGNRFTNTSNTRYMPYYTLTDVIAGRSFKFKEKKVAIQLSINNIFDIDYQAIAWQPMPGRNYQLLIRFDLTSK